MATAGVQPARERTKLADVTNFLAERRMALIGVSRQPQDITRPLLRELGARGYEVVPVTPYLNEAEGRPCVARVQDIVPPVTAALVFTGPVETLAVLRDCVEAGIKKVWIRAGLKRLDPAIIAFCREHDLTLIVGECPFMFLPGTQLIHGFHGVINRMIGRYPK